MGRRKEREEENMRKQDSRDGERTERESKERDILIEETLWD